MTSRSGSEHRLDSESDISLIPYEDAYEDGFEDMYRRIPAIEKVRDLIGWTPTRSLDEIIDDVASSHRVAEVV